MKRNHLHFLLTCFTLLSFSSGVFAETDVTAKVQVIQGRLLFNRTNNTNYVDVSIKNISQDVLLSPIKVVIDSISDPTVKVNNTSGTTSDGKPYFEYSTASGHIIAGDTTAQKKWDFSNPNNKRFTYVIRVMGLLPDAAALIGPGGGEVQVNDLSLKSYGAKVVIPNGALFDTIPITINQNELPPVISRFMCEGGPALNFSNGKNNFLKKVIITLPYDDKDNDGIVDKTGASVDFIMPFYFNENIKEWQQIETYVIDKENKIVSFETDHFSTWLLGIEPEYLNDSTYIFTIDGLSFLRTFTSEMLPLDFKWSFRRSYLQNALLDLMPPNFSKADIFSFGGIENESWDGDPTKTKFYVEYLTHVLKEKYYEAKRDGKRFVLITHSWGTVLGHLALEFSPEVVPDLFITLSSPLGSNNISVFPNTQFFNLPSFTVGSLQQIIAGYVEQHRQETYNYMLPRKPSGIRYVKWINYWDTGDIISGPLQYFPLEENDDSFENKKVANLSQRNFSSTALIHALTSLDKLNYKLYNVSSEQSAILEGKILQNILSADNMRDSDGDGVTDETDKCSDTDSEEHVNAFGCGLSQIIVERVYPENNLENVDYRNIDFHWEKINIPARTTLKYCIQIYEESGANFPVSVSCGCQNGFFTEDDMIRFTLDPGKQYFWAVFAKDENDNCSNVDLEQNQWFTFYTDIDSDKDGVPDKIDTDDDKDMMPDEWEIANGLNPLVYDSNDDYDKDGFSNFTEFKFNSNPRDRNSLPKEKYTLIEFPSNYQPIDLNDTGYAVGNFTNDPDSCWCDCPSTGFKWDSGSGVETITPEGLSYSVLDINNIGEIIGIIYKPSGIENFVIDTSGVYNLIDKPNFANSSYPVKINDSGYILIQAEYESPLTRKGFILKNRESNPQFLEIGMTPIDEQTWVYNINNLNQVVGSSSVFGAFIWDEIRGTQTLGNLGGGYAHVLDLNDRGELVGISETAEHLKHACYWNSSNDIVDIGTLCRDYGIGTLCGDYSIAIKINKFGQVIGNSRVPSGDEHAFIWDINRGIEDLGTLGGSTSSALSINDLGQVIGLSKSQDGRTFAFIWDRELGMRAFKLITENIVEMKINNFGQIIFSQYTPVLCD